MKPKSKTRLLITTDFYYPHWTGISKSMQYLTQSIENKYAITVLTTQFDTKLPQEETISKTRVIRSPFLFRFSRTYFSPQYIFTFVSLLKNHDVIFANAPCTYILLVSLITKLYKKKLLIYYHGDLILPKNLTNKVIEYVFNFSTFIACAVADKIATYTTDYATHSRILKHFLKKFVPILIPIRFQNKEIVPVYQLAKLKRSNKFLIGFAGRFVEEKGFDILFSAIPEVIKQIPSVHFVFAGETKMGYENFFDLHKNAFLVNKQHISLLGLLDEKSMHFFFSNIDGIILSSRSDCFPLVQAEAMLHDVPVVCADIPGARIPVTKTGFGYLFRKENPLDLASKIILMIKSHNNIIKNKSKVIRYFHYSRNVETITRFIGQ